MREEQPRFPLSSSLYLSLQRLFVWILLFRTVCKVRLKFILQVLPSVNMRNILVSRPQTWAVSQLLLEMLSMSCWKQPMKYCFGGTIASGNSDKSCEKTPAFDAAIATENAANVLLKSTRIWWQICRWKFCMCVALKSTVLVLQSLLEKTRVQFRTFWGTPCVCTYWASHKTICHQLAAADAWSRLYSLKHSLPLPRRLCLCLLLLCMKIGLYSMKWVLRVAWLLLANSSR